MNVMVQWISKISLDIKGSLISEVSPLECVISLLNVFGVSFQVVIAQMNGEDYPSQSIHVLHIGKMRMKLCKGKSTVAKEYYSITMQVI